MNNSAQNIQFILSEIAGIPKQHACWLNTLSFLEFLGSRKIARSALPSYQSEMRLRHLAEEARHAHFFKRMIARVVESADAYADYRPENLFCGVAAGRYFHGLDAQVRNALLVLNPKYASAETTKNNTSKETHKFVSKKLSPQLSELCYLYVTLLVEERAGRVYPVYDRVLQERQIPIRLSGILAEEERHLSDMQSMLRVHPNHTPELLTRLRQLESKLYQDFEEKLMQAVQKAKAA